MRILIVEDGRQRGALAAVRSLGRAGHDVGVAAPVTPLSGWSRWCGRTHRIAPPTAAAAATDVTRLVAEHGYEVVFPVGDAECLTLATARDQLGAVLGAPAIEPLRRALDKSQLAEAASAAGLRTPDVIHELPATFPPAGIVVKQQMHGQEHGTGRASHSPPVLARTHAEAAAALRGIEEGGGTPLLQEAIAGRLIAYCIVRDRQGRLLGDVQQKALRTFPPGAGVSTRAVTVPVEPPLRAGCNRLLDELGVSGVAEFQFIAPGEGEPTLIDLNPRFYGSLALAIRAGVDLPALALALAAGDAVAPAPPARPGVRYQWLEGDLRRAALERRSGLLRDAASSLTWAPGAVHSIASARDPAPALRFSAQLLARGLKKAVPGKNG